MSETVCRTDWFRDAQWGVICHYLAAPVTSGLKGAAFAVDEWNRRVDSFDTLRLANQLAQAGAGYLVITLGQNSGFYCAPNPTYDTIVGIRPGKCSQRDLVSDLYEALAPKEIALMVYLPSGAPAADPVAVEKLVWEWGFVGGWPHGWMVERTGKRLVSFQHKWEAVIRDWSLRWGEKVRGWVIDGCYFPDEMYQHADEPNFFSFAAAMRAGNPNSIVAFNPGLAMPIVSLSEAEDFTFGEVDGALYVGHREPGDVWTCYDGKVGQAQLHTMTFLGANWGMGEPRFPDELVSGYTHFINRHKGVVTWDVPISEDGQLPQAFIDQLAKIRIA